MPPCGSSEKSGDLADALPAEARVEPLGVAAGHGVEHEQRPAALARASPRRRASAPRRGPGGARGGAPASSRCRRGAAGSRAGRARAARCRTMPLSSSATSSARSPSRDARGDAAPERLGASRRQRVHEAHRRAAFDAVDQHARRARDLRVGRPRSGGGWTGGESLIVSSPRSARSRSPRRSARSRRVGLRNTSRPVEHDGEAVAGLEPVVVARRR